jgi:hypothetical protein
MALDRAKAGDSTRASLFADAIQDNFKNTDDVGYIESLQSAKSLGW